MSQIVEFRLRCSDFVLAPSLAAVSAVTLELVAEVATDPERPSLCFWASGDDVAALEDAMETDPTLAAVERCAEVVGSVLYRIQPGADADVTDYPTRIEAGGKRLEARWADGWWHARMRVPDRGTVGEVREWCERVGAEFELECVYTDEEARAVRPELTDEQREVLRTAHDLGYFEIPRRGSMADVAAEIGVSSQAVSERLRRGYRRLVEGSVL